MSLSIQNLYKTFNGHVALERIHLDIASSEFVCLLGPSGCGKTTLLRIIAGLLAADGGRISLDGRDLAALPARERGFGIVFQSYSLFPHMTIAQNIGYGLQIRKTPAAAIAERVQELLEVVRLPGFGERYPGQLSGGQQQRVAIARALAVNPSLLLLDEPLSALDARVRVGLRQELREVQQRLGIPTLMVTHDQEEAMSMADKIVCMNAGRIEQVGSPRELYLHPRTRFVADFMGHSNLLPADAAAQLLAEGQPIAPPPAEGMELCVRPEHLRLTPRAGAGGRVVAVSFLGSIQRVQVQWQGRALLVETGSDVALQEGEAVEVALAGVASCAWVRADGKAFAPAGDGPCA
ncbi:ATP-binding cassette domain-containing protein [Corticibacter populi]|uniref:ATP-binding cassette domain-containing protein n=1 Tax=Corticibacter populi TaxID=1550736 RepID=A0A3M6QR75_9BURK|nr:ATP-binding cassette domain-containing protein [Corticibacter populi]RMX05059.1 ATP-binding cassette domain-containing protein [Corticibacter populi]RZS33818.1 iron(III) transport system ATP-binding protein [Corticibacter populi]